MILRRVLFIILAILLIADIAYSFHIAFIGGILVGFFLGIGIWMLYGSLWEKRNN